MSEAERLADALDEEATSMDMGRKPIPCTKRKAAAELRRLSAELAALKAAIGEPAAWVDERVIQWLASRPSSASTNITTKLAAAKCPERPMPLYTHPAPQAKPQPLSDDRIEEVTAEIGMNSPLARWAIARKVEAAHGITKE